ncbi:hypothetical protein DYB32_004651 [Aphanomyces invadans]|uniref:Uncharacterized protein n=1 Tax=Aphanomyces invadans TaxID=157072 RepID=A0A418AWY1_9STRA|nr:hypothetical protein DYB32_004651 [Aphanomyces invadans]
MVRRVVNEAENMTKDIQRQIAEQQRLGVHLRRTEEECKAAFLRFLPSMKTRIYKQLDLEHIVESLKVLDKNEKDTRDKLWDDAKLIVPETPAAIVEPSSASAKPWLNELRDILDRCHHFLHRHLLFMSCMAYMHSPFLLQALQDATNSAFERMTTRLVASLFHIPQKQDVPLAKIIPQLKSEAANLFKPQLQDELWDDLTKRDSLQHLTTSIFAPNAASIPSYGLDAPRSCHNPFWW